MCFPESIRTAALERAHFACVWCQEKAFFIQVHHIIPRAAGGSDAIDNAAPLCAQCHTNFGGNPDMRAQTRQRRDWWWDLCARREPEAAINQPSNVMLAQLQAQEARGQRTDETLNELKGMLINFLAEREAAVNSARTAAELIQASSSSTASLQSRVGGSMMITNPLLPPPPDPSGL